MRRRAPRRPELQVTAEEKSGMLVAGFLHDVPSNSWPFTAHAAVLEAAVLTAFMVASWAASWAFSEENVAASAVEREEVSAFAEASPADVDVDRDAVALDVEVVSALTEDDTPATLAVMRHNTQ